MAVSAIIRSYAAEFLCTYIFIFTICSAGLNEAKLGTSTASLSSGVSTAFVAIAIIFAFGPLSGAHFNPAVTVGAMVARKITFMKGAIYIFLQLLASIAAVSTLTVLFSDQNAVSRLVLAPDQKANIMSALLFEFILTFMLVFIIFATAMGINTRSSDLESQALDDEAITTNKQRLLFAPFAIGMTLGYLCFLAGSVSGGAFNPARATAPALLAFNLKDLWVYWVGDVAGGVAAALLYTYVFAL